MKKKLKLSRDTPASVFHSHLFYNLSNVHHRLIAAQSDALYFSLNDDKLLGASTRIRIQQLQQKEWLLISSLIVWPYNTASNLNNWIELTLCEWNRLNISCQIPFTHQHLIEGGKTPISSLMPELYRNIAGHLRDYNLLFVEQLVYQDGKHMLTFYDLSMHPGFPQTRRLPA